MYGFRKAFEFNLLLNASFTKLIHESISVLKSFSFSLWKMHHTSFLHSSIFIFSNKNGKSLRTLCYCSGYLVSTSKHVLYHYPRYNFISLH